MSASDLSQHLVTIIDQAKALGLTIRLADPSDLVVIGDAETLKDRLGTIVKLATDLGLRVKWLNDGTLVAIGIPTRKQHGKEAIREQAAESGQGVLRGGGAEGRQGQGSDEGPRSSEDERGGQKTLGEAQAEKGRGE